MNKINQFNTTTYNFIFYLKNYYPLWYNYLCRMANFSGHSLKIAIEIILKYVHNGSDFNKKEIQLFHILMWNRTKNLTNKTASLSIIE